jgi:hypothetical protein
LLLSQILSLTSHQKLLLLLSALKVVLLLRREGGAKAWEGSCKGRLNSTRLT